MTWTWILGGALALVVASSKHLLIFNEETLVAATFFAFVLFVRQYFGHSLGAALQERQELLQGEMEQALRRRGQLLESLQEAHHRVLAWQEALRPLLEGSHHQVRHLTHLAPKALEKALTHQVLGALSALAQVQGEATPRLLAARAEALWRGVLLETSHLSQEALLEQALAVLHLPQAHLVEG